MLLEVMLANFYSLIHQVAHR